MFKRSVLLALAVAAGCAGSQAGAPKANAPTPVAKSGRPEYKPSLYPLRHAPREANEGEGGYQSHVQDH